MIKVRTPPPSIRHTGSVQPLVDPQEVARALGTNEVYQTPSPAGAPHVIYALREDIMRRLSSKGGRPALEGVERRRKIPFTEDDWGTLVRIAKQLSRPGRSVAPAQIASAIVHVQLEKLTSTPPPLIIGEVEGLGEDLIRARKVVLENYEILDVEGIIKWTRLFPGLERVWVIVLDFLDDTEPYVLEEVVHNIKERDVQFTYFVRAEDNGRGGRFSKLKARIRDLVGDEMKVRTHVVGVPLYKDEFMWLQTDHVIANPHRKREAVGFQYFREASKPTFAVRMEDYALGSMIEKLEVWASRRSEEFGKLYRLPTKRQ